MVWEKRSSAFEALRAPQRRYPTRTQPVAPAGLRPEEDRVGRQASCLHPASGDDGMANEAVPVVQVQRQREVLMTAAEEIEGDPRSRGRVVDPPGDVAQVLGDRFRMARH